MIFSFPYLSGMFRYLFRRLSYGIGVMIAVVLLVTTIIYSAKVDPASLTFGQRADTGSMEAKRLEYGLDKPLLLQQWDYLNDISPLGAVYRSQVDKYSGVHLFSLGNRALLIKAPYLRTSYQTGEQVSTILLKKIPRTAALALGAILVGAIIGIFFGVIASLFKDSILDRFIVTLSVVGFSLPSYVMAMILAIVFAYLLGEYTGLNITGGLTTLDDEGNEVFVWKNLILPVLALGIRPIGIFTQLTRSAMLDVLNQDYIRTAKAKGLPASKVLFKHALRNALNPVSTSITGWFASLLAGAFFVENVFSYDGLGLETIKALDTYDIPVVLGVVLFLALVFIIVNIISDLIYAWLDPRVRVS